MSVPNAFPDHVVIVGGGRWARIIVGILAELLPQSARISIHSPHNAEQMRVWCDAQHISQKTLITSRLPERMGDQSAAIIVNAATDHFASATLTLGLGMPTLVEKPVALSLAETQELGNLADITGVFLGSAQVFLFAEYLGNFLTSLPPSEPIHQLHLEWRDAQNEARHGEVKSYDAGLPVFADCMPHAVAILGRFADVASMRFNSLQVERGGAKLRTDFELGGKAISVLFERGASERERKLTVGGAGGAYALDFSTEPGVISTPGGKQISGMAHWDPADSPMRSMISTFLARAAGRNDDQRLGMGNALTSSRLVDVITPIYRQAQQDWLFEQMSRTATSDPQGLEYAYAEITHATNRHVDADRRAQNLHKFTRTCAECNPGSDSGRLKLSELIAALYGSVEN